MVKISCEAGRIYIKFSPVTQKHLEAAKALPGRRWDDKRRAWYAPATVAVAVRVLEAFGDAAPVTDAAFDELAREAAAMREAQKFKDAESLPQPEINKLPMWRHQLRGYHFALPMRAVLLDMHMGTGKSKVAVELVINRNHRRVLICAPKSVITGPVSLDAGGNMDALSVWAREFYRHAGHDRWRCWNDSRGTCKERAKKMQEFLRLCDARGEIAVVLMNYEAAWRDDMAAAIMGARFDLVIADESHKIKAPGGSASRFFEKLGAAVPYRLCLTGTPTPHSPLDLYGQYRFLDKGIYGGSFTLFRARYAVMGGYGGHEVKGYQNLEDFRARMEMIAYHCGDEELDLPEVMPPIYRNIELGAKTLKVYAQMEKTFIADVDAGRVTAANALSKLLRLQQITSGYLPIDDAGNVEQVGNEKREVLEDVLEGIATDEPVVVFARFRHDLDQIKKASENCGRRYAELSGRGNELEKWQNGGADVIGVQIQAGGVGISLVRARYCVYYSLGFSLGDYEQSRARTQRPGQKRRVTYIHLIAGGTIDQRVYDALKERKNIIEYVVHGIKSC